jgi:class 3 adenylate cyclase
VARTLSTGDSSFEEATALAEAMVLDLQKEAAAEEARSAATAVDVLALVEDVSSTAEEDLTTPVHVNPARGFPAISTLPLEKNKDGKYVWREIAEASVVATDLKGSTSVSYSKQNRVGARLYQASTGGCSRVMQRFAPDFVDIQGDGLFAIFAGDLHAERAMCAAISLNTFGSKLAKLLKVHFGAEVPAMTESGLKIGADTGLLLVKKIGVRGDHNEPVWAGKPVNYASKCASEVDAGAVLVTSRFFKPFLENQFVRYSCGCVGGEQTADIRPLWIRKSVDVLGSDSEVREVRSTWCQNCGGDFAKAILAGKRERGLNTGSLPKWRPDPDAEADDA